MQGPKTDRTILKKLRQGLESRIPFQGETINYRKDRSKITLQWRIDPVRNDAGKIIHWIAFLRDITSTRQAEELVRLQKIQLAHSSRLSMLGEITAGVTHDLLRPVFAMGNFAHACRLHLERSEEVEKSKLLVLIQSISESVDHTKAVISRLLEFARRGEPQRSSVMVCKPIDDVLQLLEYELRKNRITVKTELQPGISVLVDTVQFQQVLINLLHNACEAFQEADTDDAQIVIQVEAREEGMCVLSIKDNGPGIPPESVERVFASFYTTRPRGLGLGLAISKTIVEAHNGTIWLTRNPDRGLKFHFTMLLTTVAERKQ